MREQLGNPTSETTWESSKLWKLLTTTQDLINKIHNPESFAKDLLWEAGVEIDGNNPWDPQVHDPSLYRDVVLGGNLALWEAYMDGRWECEDLPEFFKRVLWSWLNGKTDGIETLIWKLHSIIVNLQTKKRSRAVIENHYNLGNELYESFLDDMMAYSCWYFPRWDESLDEAQIAKVRLIADKLCLEPWMHVADIGCGWWQIANRIAEERGVKVTWVTLSDEQVNYTRWRLHPDVTIRFWDYRDVLWEGEFDAVYTIWMTEHVGPKNLPIFTHKVDRSLRDQWRFLWHAIWSNRSILTSDQWMNKYIFEWGKAASQAQIWRAIEPTGLVLEDVHNFWPDYAKTLKMWRERFIHNFPELQKFHPQYDARFYRMFIYYFSIMEASFTTRGLQLYQNVYSKWIEDRYVWVR